MSDIVQIIFVFFVSIKFTLRLNHYTNVPGIAHCEREFSKNKGFHEFFITLSGCMLT